MHDEYRKRGADKREICSERLVVIQKQVAEQKQDEEKP